MVALVLHLFIQQIRHCTNAVNEALGWALEKHQCTRQKHSLEA